MEIPLPINQDSNTNIRPYPCDFCSRRFRKKANLMNHMVAHQTDRPHSCNLCGARYVRRCDLNNHLKIHAYAPLSRDVPEDNANNGNSLAPEEDLATTVKGRRKKVQSSVPRKRKGNNVAGLPKRNNTDDVSGVKMEMGKYVSHKLYYNLKYFILLILHTVAIMHPVRDGTRKCLSAVSSSHRGGPSPILLSPTSASFAVLVLRERKHWLRMHAFMAVTVHLNVLPVAKCFGMLTVYENTCV